MQPHINLPAPYTGLMAAFTTTPLIAILRGITPDEAAGMLKRCTRLGSASLRCR